MKRVRLAEDKTEPFVRLMLDSGAFSAYILGKEIDIDAYCDFIIKHKHLIDTYINLDVIPGVVGRRTQEDVALSARRSYENWQYMKSRGLSPIPVFHQGEAFHWLERMIGDGQKYICISSDKQLSTTSNRKWLDMVFTMITNKDGVPCIDTHGMGITIWEFMHRYPWASVDSTSWSLIPGYGKIIVPSYSGGVPRYDRAPISVNMSGWFNKSKATQKRQFEALGPMEQSFVLKFIEEEVGVSLAQCRYDDKARRRVTLTYFLRFQENCGEIRFKHRKHDLGT